MKLQKTLLLLSTLVLMLGASSCQKEKKGEVLPEGSTYMSLVLDLAIDPTTKAEDGVHNPKGNWEGRDKINSVDIYIVYGANEVVKYNQAVVLTNTPGASTDRKYETAAFKVQPTIGAVDLYVVVNNAGGTTAGTVEKALNDATTKAAFEAAYKTATTNAYNYAIGSAGIYATTDGSVDEILMTGAALSKTINPNITQDQAKMTTTTPDNFNQFKFEVRRSAARVAVTTKHDLSLNVTDGGTTTWGTLSGLKWTYAQFEQKTHLLWDATATSADGTTLHYTTKSPNWDWAPADLNAYINTSTGASTRYDYSLVNDLSNLKTINTLPSTETIAEIIANGGMSFITETTHKHGDDANTGYRKGNTPYVMVQGVFVPADGMWATDSGENEKTAYNDASNTDKHLYYNPYKGKFYADLTRAISAGVPAVVADDGVITYTNSKVYYFAWLNPDNTDLTEVLNSPVLRNNIYHINIAGFTRIGLSGNPYNPDTSNPAKPDPDEPVPSVTDLLRNDETYMSAEITVINWGVHSAPIIF